MYHHIYLESCSTNNIKSKSINFLLICFVFLDQDIILLIENLSNIDFLQRLETIWGGVNSFRTLKFKENYSYKTD